MALVLLDSSVLIALANSEDSHHEICHLALNEGSHEIFASTLSITEALSSPLVMTYEFALGLLESLHKVVDRFIALDEHIAFWAASLRARQRMTLPDAIISATADAVNAELWTCDRELAKKSKNSRLLL